MGPFGTLTVLGLAALSTATAGAPSRRHPCLAVVAKGFASAHGHAILRLYRCGDDVTATRPLSSPVMIEGRSAAWCLDIDPGAYAVNDNGREDHDVLGSQQSRSVSRAGSASAVFAGFPTFAKLRFSFIPGMAAIPIVVH